MEAKMLLKKQFQKLVQMFSGSSGALCSAFSAAVLRPSLEIQHGDHKVSARF